MVKKTNNSKYSNTNKYHKCLKPRLHLGLKGKVFFCFILALLFFILSFVFNMRVVKKDSNKPIDYNENAVVDYKVYLKDNDFYNEKYLTRGKAYIASLIDHIDTTINYVFRIDKNMDMEFEYKIVGELVIENVNGSSRYYEDKFDLSKPIKKELKNNNELAINDTVSIDYGKYNLLANKFRSSYGVDTNSYLNISISVKKKTIDNDDYPLSNSREMEVVKIPLSERAIEININSSNSTASNQIMPEGNKHYDKIMFIFSVLSLIFSAYFFICALIYVFYSMTKVSKYDKQVNKILKCYDRLIVEISTAINFDDYNIIKVKEFKELLDVRDNLKLPINYYIIEPHKKGLFYIKCNDEIYMYVIDINSID